MTEKPPVVVPIEGQSFSSEQDWINRATRCLTGHPEYLNTEHGDAKGWRGAHFTALCFDQAGNRMRKGGDFKRATAEGTYPVWWIWPDQIVDAVLPYHHRQIAERMDEGDGFWEACSGCQEGVDGHVSAKDYPYSRVFRCQPGGGCSECGGLGVIWDNIDYDAMARSILADEAVNACLSDTEQHAQAARCGCRGADDWCPCQNTPDRETMIARRAAS